MKLNTQNLSIGFPACQRANRSDEKRVQDLQPRMTLAEMVTQLICATGAAGSEAGGCLGQL